MEVEDGGGAAAADSSRNTASPGLFDLVRSLWSPTPATPSENGNSSSARLAPPKAPVLIASSPIRKRRRSAVDEGTEVDDDSGEQLGNIALSVVFERAISPARPMRVGSHY
eukprot:m.52448 g.52448  ORF g.52448 m.52448 type:complete len:111 (+) comp9102_c0_seq1:62-394(+)